MYITKDFDTRVDLLDPNEIYTANINELLLQKLSTRYVGRCHKSSYIVEIKSINRRSQVEMVRTRLDGGASVSVNFTARCIVFVEGEILNNCEVIEIYRNGIQAEHKIAGVKLRTNDNESVAATLAAGQKIPVEVIQVRYITNRQKVSMIARPYFPSVTEKTYYKVKNAMSMAEIDKLGILFEDIDEERKLHVPISNTPGYKFFRGILHPYKSQFDYTKEPEFKEFKFESVKFELKEMLEIKNGVILYPDLDEKVNGRFFYSSQVTIDSNNSQVVDIDAYPALFRISNKYLIYLRSLRGLVETYKTPKDINNLRSYWVLCNNARIMPK